MHISTVRYTLQDYDHLLLVASWGLPKDYKKAQYSIEVEKHHEKGYERAEISISNSRKLYCSSTAAIRDLLEKKLGVRNLDLLVFVQDTILMRKVIGSEHLYFDKEYSRHELERDLFAELYSSNEEVARELDIYEAENYSKFVKFVPGVIAARKINIRYSWREKYIYDVLKEFIVFYTYKKLISTAENAKRVAVLLDTTHGINYFVTALSDGVLVATTLYALNRFVNKFINNKPQLDELIIYHYNSDPIYPSRRDEHSLTIHLLSRIPVVKKGKISLARIRSVIEEPVSIEGFKTLTNKLSCVWRDINWKRIIWTLQCFSRGLIVWSLRIAIDISPLPQEKEIENIIKNIKLSFRKDVKEYKIKYVYGDKKPISPIIEYLTLTRLLDNLAKKIEYDKYDEVCGYIAEIIDYLKEDSMLRKELKGLINYLAKLKDTIKSRGKIVCLNVKSLKDAIETLYDSPYLDVNLHELKVLEEYLLGKREIRWEQIFDNIYREPKTKQAFFIDQGDTKTIISTPDSVETRDFYAHVGLAYGLPWFSLGMHDKVLLCLGDYDKVIRHL